MVKTGLKTIVILLTITYAFCIFGTQAYAAWWEFWKKKSFKEASTDAARASVNYPSNVVTESVNVVGKTAKDATGVVVDTVTVTGETLTGDVKKAPEIIATPVRETAETVKDAAVGTVEIPGKASEKTGEQMQ